MAQQDDFAPKTQESDIPNFLSYSRGYTSGGSAIGTLFGDLGKALGVGVQALDQAASMRVNEEVRASVENADTRMGIDSRLPTRGEEVVALPKDAQLSLKKIEAAKRMMESGRITPTQYQVRLLADSKAIRARYPGYADQIDAAYSRLTGSTPANAIRRSINQAAEDASRRAEASASAGRRFLDQHLANIEDPKLRQQAALPGAESNPAFMANVRMAVADKVGRDEKLKTRNEWLNNLALERTHDKTQSVDTYSELLADISRSIVNSSPDLEGLKTISKEITSARSAGLSVSPEQANKLQVFVSNFDKYFNDRLQNARVSARYMDAFPEERNRIEAAVTKDWEMTKKALLGGDFEHLAANTAMVKSRLEYSEASMLKDSEVLTNFQIYRKMLGDNALGYLVNNGMDKFITDPMQKRLKLAEQADSVKANARTLSQKLTTLRDNGATEETAMSLIDDFTGALTAGVDDKSYELHLARQMYASDGRSLLAKIPSATGRQAIADKLTTPRIAARIKEMSKQDPSISNRFEEFFVSSLPPVMQPFINTINSYNASRNNSRIVYDPRSMSFKAVDNPNVNVEGRFKDVVKDTLISPLIGQSSPKIMQAVDALNNQLKKVKEVSSVLDSTLSKDEVSASAMALVRTMGFDFNSSESYPGIPVPGPTETQDYKDARARYNAARKQMSEEQWKLLGDTADSIRDYVNIGIDYLIDTNDKVQAEAKQKKNPPIE